MRKLIIANWKLNPLTLASAQQLAASVGSSKHEVVICPPSAFLAQIKVPILGAQDCFWKLKGPFTGETSPAQLKDLGVRYCIIGHSERRALGETDDMVAAKLQALLEQGITPVLCVGFGTTVGEDKLDVTEALRPQLDSALRDTDPKKVVVAYEPVWAIGTGKPATSEHAEQIALFIKTKYGIEKVLYGGSVNGVNAQEFLSQNHIDGLLVGSNSLIPDEFNKIITS
ncbi:MAG: triose-phosphate isomerase [Candidatus Doudnabacteria bacterium]|nr:triose-phosphate isomerase [Candidatus Doudnabacteria bacterium]